MLLRIAPLYLATSLLLWMLAVATGHAETRGFLAGALACPAGVEGPDCTRETALDVLTQPVALVTECPMIGTLLATHLSLPAGGTHKTFCERRRS
ncbi:hypothetical protein ABIE45_002788 [Methylobacterium sp. OAE515]|uniref:hypothetical protein n=1 Tax=Methylobacterium sp. OAE515 TaxID=2817895 RepID=UPI0019D8D8CF